MHGSIPQMRCPSSSETILSEKRLKRLKFQIRPNFVSHRYFQNVFTVFLAAIVTLWDEGCPGLQANPPLRVLASQLIDACSILTLICKAIFNVHIHYLYY